MSHTDVSSGPFLTPKSALFLFIGVLSAVFAIKGFMIPNHFLDGGVAGISILLHEIFHIPVALPLVLFNLPFIYIGYKHLGKAFAYRSLIAVGLLGLGLALIPVPAITEDHILVAAFGGFFIGVGIGFVIRGGGVIDGIEALADYWHERTGVSSAEIILVINSCIFLIIAIELGLDKALYSIITYFTALMVSDYVANGFEEHTALTIISPKAEEVKNLLVNQYGKAITVYKGERGYLPGSFELKSDCDILVTVVNRLEIQKLKNAVNTLDPQAFMYVSRIKEVKGGVVNR